MPMNANMMPPTILTSMYNSVFFQFFFFNISMFSTIKVEKVVKEPRNPTPKNKFISVFTFRPITIPSKNEPNKLTIKVAVRFGNFVYDCRMFPVQKREIAPRNPPNAMKMIVISKPRVFYTACCRDDSRRMLIKGRSID